MADHNRISVIINEIKYWKSHNLLPKEQCDFLLALYTNGDSIMETQETTATEKSRSHFYFVIEICLLLLLLPFSFLVLYFTEFHPGLQLGILILFLFYAFWSYRHHKQRSHWAMQLALVIALFLILLLSIFISDQLFDKPNTLHAIIPINFIGWFIVGYKLKFRYLIITSLFLLFFAIIYFTL